jgi:hypothetical protein
MNETTVIEFGALWMSELFCGLILSIKIGEDTFLLLVENNMLISLVKYIFPGALQLNGLMGPMKTMKTDIQPIKINNIISNENCQIRVIIKLPNSEQSYKWKVKTHKYIHRQNQSTTGNKKCGNVSVCFCFRSSM